MREGSLDKSSQTLGALEFVTRIDKGLNAGLEEIMIEHLKVYGKRKKRQEN
jgi:hypothetical protein